ncbi:hypothetical protein UPYG_G00170980 [Umbra pygmaea]|uniref:Uncharacterized protein n=1 Tax=Umbra pygmaea TaxID=75934 RepID=A0ABD0WNN9_UMBPY
MASPWCLPLVVLVSTLAVSHSAEPGSNPGKRRVAQPLPGNTVQYPAVQYPEQSFQSHGHGRERGGGHGGTRGVKASTGAGLLSHRPLHLAARPEDDGTGLEGLSPVRLEKGPGGRGREKGPRGFRNPSQARDNHPLGPRRGRGQEHGQHFDHRRNGGRSHKGRHAKVFLAEPELSSVLKDRGLSEVGFFSSAPAGASPSHSLTPPNDPPSPMSAMFGSGSSAVTTVIAASPDASPSLHQTTEVCPGEGAGRSDAYPGYDTV